jgi:hypothetical protein
VYLCTVHLDSPKHKYLRYKQTDMLPFSIAALNARRTDSYEAFDNRQVPVFAPPIQRPVETPRLAPVEAKKPAKPQAPGPSEDPTAELAKLLL